MQEKEKEEGNNYYENLASKILVPWGKFKLLLFDIYESRIRHTAELSGSANTNYCSLNEFILIYFVEKLRIRQKAEQEILSLIINLFYYYDIWERARLMVFNLQLVVIETSDQKFDR